MTGVKPKTRKPKATVRYSEAFKQEVVRGLAEGKYAGPCAAARAQKIGGSGTVYGWVRKYGRGDLLPRRITVSTMSEEDQSKALKKRVRDLERTLSDTHMKELLGEAYLEIACEQLGVSVEEFKKKAAMARSSARGPLPPPA